MKTLNKLVFCVGLIFIFSARITTASPLNGTTLDQISGVSFHFTNPDVAAFQRMKSIGIGIARTDLKWQAVEASRGIYNFAIYDALSDAMRTAGVRPEYTLDYSNPIYEPPVTTGTVLNPTTINPPPIHASSIAAYANFAAAAAARYKGRNVIWEIWNEPNWPNFWQTGPNAGQYADMAIAACWAIRNADPTATIIGPAVSGFPTDFLKTVFSRGLLECLDGVSIHPYRGTNAPETVQPDYDALKALIAQYTSPGRAKQIAIVDSEWGYTAALNGGVNYSVQADYAVRQKLMDMSNGLGASIWYDWKNDGTDPVQPEQNYGIIDANGYAKLPYTALSNLYQKLQGMFFVGRMVTSDARDYVFLFTSSSGAQCIVSWTTGPAHSLKILPRLALQTVPGNLAQLGIDINAQLSAQNTTLALMLSSTPAAATLK